MLKCLFWAFCLTPGVTEGREIVVANELLRRLMHGIGIQLMFHVPSQSELMRQWLQTIVNSIAVGTPDRREAGIKSLMHFFTLKDDNRVWLAMEI